MTSYDVLRQALVRQAVVSAQHESGLQARARRMRRIVLAQAEALMKAIDEVPEGETLDRSALTSVQQEWLTRIDEYEARSEALVSAFSAAGIDEDTVRTALLPMLAALAADTLLLHFRVAALEYA